MTVQPRNRLKQQDPDNIVAAVGSNNGGQEVEQRGNSKKDEVDRMLATSGAARNSGWSLLRRPPTGSSARGSRGQVPVPFPAGVSSGAIQIGRTTCTERVFAMRRFDRRRLLQLSENGRSILWRCAARRMPGRIHLHWRRPPPRKISGTMQDGVNLFKGVPYGGDTARTRFQRPGRSQRRGPA